jgi:hypothetical protein
MSRSAHVAKGVASTTPGSIATGVSGAVNITVSDASSRDAVLNVPSRDQSMRSIQGEKRRACSYSPTGSSIRCPGLVGVTPTAFATDPGIAATPECRATSVVDCTGLLMGKIMLRSIRVICSRLQERSPVPAKVRPEPVPVTVNVRDAAKHCLRKVQGRDVYSGSQLKCEHGSRRSYRELRKGILTHQSTAA